jgi:hypothetical protein
VLRSTVRVVLVAGVIAAVGLAFAIIHLNRPDAVAPPSPFVTKWRYATEQDWIVAHVVQALANMAHYARTGAAPEPTASDVSVETGAGPSGAAIFTVRLSRDHVVRLTAGDHIWSPAMYTPLVTELLGPAPAAPSAVSPRESVTLAALTRPRTDVMVAESARVSRSGI